MIVKFEVVIFEIVFQMYTINLKYVHQCGIMYNAHYNIM